MVDQLGRSSPGWVPITWDKALSIGADPVTSEIVTRCLFFYQSSDKALGQAVAHVNSSNPGSSRLHFATPKFNHDNAALAPAE